MSEAELRSQLQQISGTLQQYDEFRKQIESQLDTLQSYALDLSRTRSTLLNLKDEGDKEESLIQLGTGVMVKAKPLDVNNVFYSVGAGVIVEKSTDEAIKGIDTRLAELDKEGQALQDQLQQILNQMGLLERQGQSILQQLQSGSGGVQYDPNLVK